MFHSHLPSCAREGDIFLSLEHPAWMIGPFRQSPRWMQAIPKGLRPVLQLNSSGATRLM